MKKYFLIILLMLGSYSLLSAQTLQDYYRIAAENNPGLRAMHKEYEAALQKVQQVKSLPDPVFSFAYFISPVETRVGPQQARFSLSQMFPWFGTLKARGDAAALHAEAKFYRFINARNQLYFQVASAYYPLIELKQWIELERENIRILESYKTIATQKFENASGNMVDVLRVDILLNAALTGLEILQDKEKPLLTEFNQLLNRPENTKVAIADSFNMKPLAADFRKDSLIAANPELQALDKQVQASEVTAFLARKQGLPRVGVGLDYVMVGERQDIAVPSNGKDVIMPMISMSIPIFRKRINASVTEAQLMQESYTNQKKEISNQLVSDYEAAWFNVRKQEKLLSLYDQQIQTTQQSLELLLTMYSNSGEEFEEVLNMQKELLKFQKMQVKALAQHQIAIAKINYLTSKSF